MPARPAAAVLAALAFAAPAGLAGPASAAMLAAPPAHARPGACYAHVRQAARYAPPPGPRSSWRLSPPPPGAPGPVWCLVSEPAGPPVQVQAEREGWVRVACATGRPAHHRRRRPAPRPRAHPPVRVRARVRRPAPPRLLPVRYAPAPCCAAPPPPCCQAVRPPCCIRGPLPPAPPPVVILPVYNPAARYGEPGPHVLRWPGKTG